MDQPQQRFLVIRLSSIGDIVHALPAVAALGESFLGSQIYWAVEARYASLIEGNPFVHCVMKLDTLGWRQRFKFAETLEEVARALSAFRKISFDAVIDFQGLYKSGLLARLSQAKQRVGFAENWLREPGAGVFYTDRVAPRGREHVIEMNLALVERLGARCPARDRWQFPLPRNESDDRHVEQQLASFGAREFILVSPGGGWTSKRWDPENYAELIRRFEIEFLWTVLLTGSPQEGDLIQTILEKSGSQRAKYIPSTLIQLIALARRAQLFVGGDTGPLHLAAAVRTPVVAIFNAADTWNTPQRNGPFSPEDMVLCGRASLEPSRRCDGPTYLSGVSVDSVLEAIRKRLARAHG